MFYNQIYESGVVEVVHMKKGIHIIYYMKTS